MVLSSSTHIVRDKAAVRARVTVERRTLCSSPLLVTGKFEPTPTMDLSRFPQEKCAEVRGMYLVEGDPAQY